MSLRKLSISFRYFFEGVREGFMTEKEKRMHRVCFTGHRPEKLKRGKRSIIQDLEEEIRKAVADGLNVFITGMARGVDIWAAQIVLKLRAEGLDVRLICTCPYEGYQLPAGQSPGVCDCPPVPSA